MAFYSFFSLFIILCVVPGAPSLPFVVLPGLGMDCNDENVTKFTESLTNFTGYPGYCIDAGASCSSWLTPLEEQIRIACDKVKEMDELKQAGYNLVAFSQGNMVARGMIEFCDDAPTVRNYVSLGGPHAGIACIPMNYSSVTCQEMNDVIIKNLVYDDWIQNVIAPASFYKIPDDLELYLEKSKFLPKLNNERPDDRNDTYKERLASLDNLVLVMFEQDEFLIPKETSWFGFYNGSYGTVPVKETKLYTEDWIGLKTLDEKNKLKFYNVSGKHGEMSAKDIKRCIVPYLVGEAPAPAPAPVSSESKSENENERIVMGYSSFI